MNTALTFLERHWERLALHAFGTPAELESVLLTPRFRASAHVIFLILARHSAEVVLVIKAGRRGAGAACTLAREAANLRAVHAARPDGFESIPRLITFEEYADTPLLLETAVSGHVLKPSMARRNPGGCAEALLEWLTTMSAATAQRPADVAPALQEQWGAPLERMVRDHPLNVEEIELVARTRALVQPLERASFPLVFEHGDLSAPNLLMTDRGTLNVVDWELATPAGLPGHDLFTALAFVADARAGATAFGRAFFSPRAWAKPFVERYAAHMNLAPDLLPALFVACWSKHVARQAERLQLADSAASSSSDRWASVKAHRYFALWRHAVTHIDEIPSPSRPPARGWAPSAEPAPRHPGAPSPRAGPATS